MKRLLPEFSFDEQQLNSIARLARETSLSEQMTGILYGRGIDTAEKVKKFLSAGKSHYVSPYKMQGMREAVELITLARDEEWVVAVYGDYDADGICASTIMRAALKKFGIDPVVFVPERKNGYGLSQEVLDGIFDEYNPQLIITVDCGISNANEVAYIQEQGAEVIVTDHHELPEILPDCICVNPKFNDGYPYDNLCGAGVAFKVGCALNGESFYSYADIAAIATIADSVALTGENRDIVTEGLKIINKNPRKCYAGFLSKTGEEVNSQNVAFGIAPRINAAGRMGDAFSALKLFTSEDDREIYDLTVKLTDYNVERQRHCDELYRSAKEKLSKKGAYGRVIMLWDEEWNSGFVGIVAARLAEEYCRPALLFVKHADGLKGSARSIEAINIFDALKACGKYIDEFGGHAQAAGVNVSEENFASLEIALNEYLTANYSPSTLIPTVYTSGTVGGKFSMRAAKELELLEPCGVGNKRPMFSLDALDCTVRVLKQGSPHINIKSNGLELLYFSGIKHKLLLESAIPKKLVFEYGISNFKGREYLKGLVRDVIYSSEGASRAGEQVDENNLLNAAYPEVNCKKKYLTCEQVFDIIRSENGVYGTVFLANNYLSAQNLIDGKFDCEVFNLTSKSLNNVVLISPLNSVDLSGFKRIVWLDDPKKITLPTLEGREIEICSQLNGLDSLAKIQSDRDSLISVYKWLNVNYSLLEGCTAEEVAHSALTPFGILNFLFAIKVFEELSLIRFENCDLLLNKGAKTDLTKSELYRLINGIKEK